MNKLKIASVAVAVALSASGSAIETRAVRFPADEVPATNPRIERRGDTVTRIEVFGKFDIAEDGSAVTTVAESDVEMDSVSARIWADEARRALGLNVRTWSPLSIKRACGDRWPTVKAALVEADIYEDFIMAQELREDDPAFITGIAWAKSVYGEEAVEAVLTAAAQ